jgi:hypothetical protein
MFSKKENLVNPKNQPIQKCQSKHKRKFEVGNWMQLTSMINNITWLIKVETS